MPTAEGHGQSGELIAGKYRLMECIGRGGMGSVWRAEHATLGAQVAIKLVSPKLLGREGPGRDKVLKRFLREGRAAAAIRGPHVVQILDHGIDGDVPFMVLELLEGETLHTRLERVRALSFGQTARIVTHISRALTRAHAEGLVHRDLKPSNVFLVRNDDDEIAKILDFGLVKVSPRALGGEGTPLTQLGQLIGTPFFMSPEQFMGQDLDYRADLWAVAVIAFMCLCGKMPFDSTLPSQLLLQICTEPLPVPSRFAPVPGGFDAWFAKAASRDPTRRFQSAREMADALRALSHEDGEGTSLPRPSARPSGVQRPPPAPDDRPAGRVALLIAAAALASLALAVAATFGLLSRDRGDPRSPGDAPAASMSDSAAPATVPASAPTPAPRGTCPERMAGLPGGTFVMGANDPDFALGQPAHRVMLDGFCLDLFEVTAEDYKACSDIGECKRPPEVPDPPLPERLSDRAREKAALAELCTFGRPALARHPINCVPWQLADAYCKVQKKRLPTEAEWEYAARGAEGRMFPWGNERGDATRMNACDDACMTWASARGLKPGPRTHEGDDGFPGTAPVGSFPRGMTKDGAYDLLGNVAEWTADWLGQYASGDVVNPRGAPGPGPGEERKAVRGGAFTGGFHGAADPGFRADESARISTPAIGFRCAKGL